MGGKQSSEYQAGNSKRNWRHVPGENNPADIPTRMVFDFNVSLGDRWFKGPDFLYDKLDPKTP